MRSSQVKNSSRERNGGMPLQEARVQGVSEIQRSGKWLGDRLKGAQMWY